MSKTEWARRHYCICGAVFISAQPRSLYIKTWCEECGDPIPVDAIDLCRWNTELVHWWNPLSWNRGYWEWKNPEGSAKGESTLSSLTTGVGNTAIGRDAIGPQPSDTEH